MGAREPELKRAEPFIDDRLRGMAEWCEFYEMTCPSCRSLREADRIACGNCGGTGRLWGKGGATLSDHGLCRLVELSARRVAGLS
jgi:hypothetical protein